MDRRELTIGRPIAVPYLDEIRSLPDEQSVTDRSVELTANDEGILQALSYGKGLNPFSRIINRSAGAHVLMSNTEAAPGEVDLTNEELLRVTESLIAGRINSPDEFDIAIAEEDCFYNLVSYIVNRNFDGRPETFDPEIVQSKDYADMVAEIGVALVENAAEKLRYDDPEGDKNIADFITSIGGITTLALASGSRLVMKTTLEYLEKIELVRMPMGSPARAEAVAIEKMYNKLVSGEATAEDLENFKAGLDSDWNEALDTYSTWGVIIDCRNILRLVCGKQFDQVTAARIKRLYQERMTIFRDYWLLDQRRYELQQERGDSLEDIFSPEQLISQLDWTVLPKGDADLENAAREIVAGAQERAARGSEVRIELERLNILKNLRDMWGADKAYYARGTLNGRGRVTVEGEDRPDEYIVLVLQEIAQNGEVVCEHAIAESPIAGHNALYVLRGDVTTEHGWRNIYSLPKKDARMLGARQVKHTKGDGRPLTDLLTDRVTYLLTCTPEEFSQIEFNRDRIRIARHIGKASIDNSAEL